jgi:signal transduction histidine kinase
MQDEFVSRISHELRTPLAAIKASIGVVLANEPAGMPDVLHRLFINIDVAAEQMSHMVANLLEMARLTAGRVQVHPEPSDLRALITQVVGSMEPLAHRRGQRLETELPAEPCLALIDGPRLERVFVNLLSNAIRFGRANGRIRVMVRSEGGELVCGVHDDGPGVPEAERSHIFERMAAAADPDALTSTHGVGLGLPIARAMVELHGGRIWYEGPAEGGACFRVALPALGPSARDGPRGEAPPSREASLRSGWR